MAAAGTRPAVPGRVLRRAHGPDVPRLAPDRFAGTGYQQTWNFAALPGADRGVLGRVRCARCAYGGLATLLCFLLGFPLAYFIAFRGGRYKSLLLFLIIAPFFTSFLLRTISWKIIFSDNGMILGPLKDLGLLPESFRLLATPIAVIAGITYNFLPFMTLPLYVALEKIPPSLLEAAQDLYADSRVPIPKVTPAARAAGRHRGLAAHVHPRRGRLRQRGAAGQSRSPR